LQGRSFSDEVERALLAAGPAVARQAEALLGVPATWSCARAGRLVRGKVTLAIDPARRLVLPVEAFEVPSHHWREHADLGAVEEPDEIIADKVVASADRLARRGTLKTTDLFDLWYLARRGGQAVPDARLVETKRQDYAQPARGADLGAAARSVPMEELRAALEGVLPTADLTALDVHEVVETAAELLERFRDVV
jgi:hypothetical protein